MAILLGLLIVGPRARADTFTDTTEVDFRAGTVSNAAVTSDGDVFLAPRAERLTKVGLVVDHGPPGAYDSVRASNPFVLRESDGSYKMWYLSSDALRFRMMFADSLDGITWTKRGVAIDVRVSPWNFDLVTRASVIKEGTTYHMWFGAGFWTLAPCSTNTFWQRIYYATSSDGRTWSIQGVALDTGPPSAWDCDTVLAPWVFRDSQGTYHMYYFGHSGGWNQIGLATSTGPMGFVRHPANPVLRPGPAGDWDEVSISAPALIDASTMYYDGHNGSETAIGIALSPDGVTWRRQQGNPVLRQSALPAWDSNGVASPSFVWDPSGARVYYTGGDGTYARIGLARVAFQPSGTFLSRVHTGGEGTTWDSMAWNADVPVGTSLSLFVRVGSALDNSWSPWSQVTNPGGSSLSLPRYPDFQYRAEFATTNDAVSPALHDVVLTFTRNRAPSAVPSSPSGGDWLRDPRPTLQWGVSDPEGDPQVAFEVQLSTDSAFTEFLSSGERTSALSSWRPPPLAEGTWYWRVRVRDESGAWSGWSVESFGVDLTPPSTSSSLSGTLGSGGWYTGTVTVTLTASDVGSGVSSTSYRANGGSWQAYTAPFSVEANGAHRIEVYSTDNAELAEAPQSVSFGIDTIAPMTTSFLSGTVGDGGFHTTPVTVVLTASDETSGPAATDFRLDAGEWQGYSGPILVGEDGAHALSYRSTDAAGVVQADQSVSFEIDTIAPVTTASLSGMGGVAGFFTSPVTVSLAATDATSGVATTQYRIGGGAWQTYTRPFDLASDGAHSVEFRSTDLAGLEERVQSVRFSVDTRPLSATGPYGPSPLLLLATIIVAVLALLVPSALRRRRDKGEKTAAPRSTPQGGELPEEWREEAVSARITTAAVEPGILMSPSTPVRTRSEPTLAVESSLQGETAAQLHELDQLRAEGLITESEYAARRKELLGGL